MSHSSSTTMARYSYKNRGKAIAFAYLGMAVGEAALPVLAHFSIDVIGWRVTYGIIGAFVALLVLPTALFLIKGYDDENQSARSQLDVSGQHKIGFTGWSRKAVLRDVRFYLLLPATTAPSLVVTGLFFHHLFLAELKNWDVAWFTGSYWIYAVGSVFAMVGAGPLIDRLEEIKVLPLYLISLAVELTLYPCF